MTEFTGNNMKRLLILLAIFGCALPCWAQRPLKEDTAVVVVVGPFVDSTGAAVTAPTIASIDITAYKNDGTAVGITPAASGSSNDMVHVDDGYYSLELTTTDTSTPGYLRLTFQISGSLIFHEDFDILPANIYDSWYGSDKLQVDVTQNGGAAATGIAADAADAKAAAEANQASIESATYGLSALKTLIDALPQVADLLDSTDIDGIITANASIAAILDDTGTSGVQLPAGEITAATFGAGAIDASAIAADAIGASELAANSITSSEVADDSIDAGAIAASAIGASEIASDAIGSAEVADGAIDAATLATDTITAAKIAADSIGASEIAASAIANGTEATGFGTAQTGDSYAIVSSVTHGNAALKTLIDTIDDFVDTEVSAIKTKTDFLPSATAGASGGVFIAGTNAATTVTTSFTTTFTGNLTGNVGGNVTGSVGSISGVTFPSNFGSLGINASGHVSRVTLADTVTTLTGHTAQTGDSFARLGAPAGASIAADIAAIEAQTDDIGVAGAGLTALATQASVTSGFDATLKADVPYDVTTTNGTLETTFESQ